MTNERTQKRLLLVDDELRWLNFARQILSEAGYVAHTTPSVKDGWELLQQKPFELILVDLKKVEQEMEIFQKITDLQMQRNQFVVTMFPTELTPRKVSEIFELGAHDCVDKQYDETKFLDLINSQFKNKPATGLSAPAYSAKEPLTILIVEDDADWRGRLSDYLESQPYQIEVAGKYSAAVQLLQKKHFATIVLDLRLVENSNDFAGMKLLKLLQEESLKIPVIVVSAYGTVEHVREGFKIYNISDYIPKQHFDKGRYLRTIQKAMDRQHKER